MRANRKLISVFALAALLVATLGASAPAVSAAPPSGAEAVFAWNGIARRAITAERQPVPLAQLSLAYVHAAVYDAVVAIEGGYQPYAADDLDAHPGDSVPAAVAAAAHGVLVHFLPAQQPGLKVDYDGALAAIPGGAAKDNGVAIGEKAAANIIALRQGDKAIITDSGYTMPAPGIGVWQLPASQPPITPWMGRIRPFLIERPDQFRPGPPPALGSATYAQDYAEVQAYGGSVSSVRTPEQADVARFWTTHPIMQNNIAYEAIARGHEFSAVETARLFAMGNMIGADASIACFDAKYHYLAWRPQYAIPAGDSDGNPATVGDPTWTPLVATPAHPEYPSGHSCNNGSQVEVYAAVLGTNQIHIDLTSTAGGVVQKTRHYARANDLLHELFNARIWGGLHFRTACVAGVNIGRKVAHYAIKRFFLPQP